MVTAMVRELTTAAIPGLITETTAVAMAMAMAMAAADGGASGMVTMMVTTAPDRDTGDKEKP